jgi:hypothetical protein
MWQMEATIESPTAVIPDESVTGSFGWETAMATAFQAATAGRPNEQTSIVGSLMHGYAFAKMRKSPGAKANPAARGGRKVGRRRR